MIENCDKFGVADLLFTVEQGMDAEYLTNDYHVVTIQNTTDSTAPLIYLNYRDLKIALSIMELIVKRVESLENKHFA